MVIALLLASLSVVISAYVFIGSLDRPKKSELRDLFEKYAESVLKGYASQFRALETEWDDMYQKFAKMAGRMDRQKALSAPETPAQPEAPAPPLTRSELLKRWRNK